jgi:2-iminobutanoate/2-iminopropanoate deaminase
MKNTRRKLLAAGALAPVAAVAQTKGGARPTRKVYYKGTKPAKPIYSNATILGDLVFVAGTGVNDVEGVQAQTTKVLDQIEETLKAVGSSMEKVLKVNVFLLDVAEWGKMNEVYVGRFGADPPVRTTVAVAGIPLKGAVVEIECIASL